MSSFSPREADIRFLYSSPDILQNSGFDFVIFAPHFLAWFKVNIVRDIRKETDPFDLKMP